MQPTTAPPASTQPTGGTHKTARPWRVAVVALLTLLVLIAAFGNQWVTDKIGKHYRGARFSDHVARAIRTYQWRFSPPGGHDFAHVWAGNLALVGTVLLMTLLLVAVVARGRGGFGQTFVGTWLVVVGATVLACYVRGTVIEPGYVGLTRRSKLNAIFFSSLAPGASALLAALAFGFVVALVAGIAAPLSRRTEVLAPVPSAADAATPLSEDDEDAPPMWERADAPYEPAAAAPYAVPYASPPSPSPPSPPPSPPPAASASSMGDDDGHTAVLPAITTERPDESEQTTQLPADAAQYEPPDESEQTTQLPAVTDQPHDPPDELTTQLPRADPDGPRQE